MWRRWHWKRLRHLLRWRRWARVGGRLRAELAIPLTLLVYVLGVTLHIWFTSPAFPSLTCAIDLLDAERVPCGLVQLMWEGLRDASLQILFADDMGILTGLLLYLAVIALWALAARLAGPGPDIFTVEPFEYVDKSNLLDWPSR